MKSVGFGPKVKNVWTETDSFFAKFIGICSVEIVFANFLLHIHFSRSDRQIDMVNLADGHTKIDSFSFKDNGGTWQIKIDLLYRFKQYKNTFKRKCSKIVFLVHTVLIDNLTYVI